MTGRSREELEQRIADAALLPPGDREREKVEAEVASAGPWAEELWLQILSDDEHLRIALRQVVPPPGLVSRLRSIPDHEPSPRLARVHSWLAALRNRMPLRYVAASLVFLVLGVMGWHRAASSAEQERRLQTLALLAMQDHMNESDMVVRASDRSLVARELSQLVAFAVRLPELGRGLKLVGGRPCHLGSHRVALTLWSGGGEVRSLYQFKPHDLGIDRLDRPIVVRPHGPVAGHTPCEVLFWSEAGAGYALVTRPAHGD